MIIVIDGYNVLKQLVTTHFSNDKERASFIARLSAYVAHKHHQVVVVFDGGPYEWPYSAYNAGVQVVYSGAHHSADEYICDYIERNKHSEMVLVSSDRMLNSFASTAGVPSIDSHSFYALLMQALHEKSHKEYRGQQAKKRYNDRVIKLHENSSAELDACMEEAARTVPRKKEDDVVVQVELDRNKLARKDRRLLQILKKL